MSLEEWFQAVPTLRGTLIREVFGGFPEEPFSVEELGSGSFEELQLDKMVIRTELDVVVPALLIKHTTSEEKYLFYLTPGGVSTFLVQGWIKEWLRTGGALMVVNYRGSEETSSKE